MNMLRGHSASLRRLCLLLLLPVLLLCAQQGAFLHELSHYLPVQGQDAPHKPHASEPCGLCLAYAGVQLSASASARAPLLLAGLSFALVAALASVARAASVPAQRNRGPPCLL